MLQVVQRGFIMSKMNENNKLAIRMLAAMVLGIVFGLICIK